MKGETTPPRASYHTKSFWMNGKLNGAEGRRSKSYAVNLSSRSSLVHTLPSSCQWARSTCCTDRS